MDRGHGRIQMLEPLAWTWGPLAHGMVGQRVRALRTLALFIGFQITDLGRL